MRPTLVLLASYLVERGEVVDDAEEVVGHLEDELLEEELGGLLLDHRELVQHFDG